MSEPFRYDTLAYPSHVSAVMHPDRLRTQARLFGLDPAPADSCRYLEIGCGSGTNLIAAALALPGAEFVGLDLAETAVAEGTATVAALRLTNVRLHHADLTRWEPDGRFDYVAAHGVYSWVPFPVRDALVALVRRALAPNGVGYLSYNALPGCHLRRVLWDMLRLHTAGAADPGEALEKTDQLLDFLIAGQEGKTLPANRWLLTEAQSMRDRPDRALTYHDDLAAVNDPVYFLDFAAHVGQHGLRFVAESELPVMADETFPADVAGTLRSLGRQNPLVREQYRDFVSVRRFRASLVGHADQPVRPDPVLVDGLHLSSSLRPLDEPGEYVSEDRGRVSVGDPLVRRVLGAVARLTPARVAVADLLPGDDPAAVGQAALGLARAGLATLHGHPFPGATTAGERPAVSLLARLQAAAGRPVASLLHTTLDLTDPASRALLPLLDGTRTRAELADAVRAAVPTLGTPEEVADGLDITLGKLARAGMLTQ